MPEWSEFFANLDPNAYKLHWPTLAIRFDLLEDDWVLAPFMGEKPCMMFGGV